MRIVFASLGSLGDLHPMLALAAEAQVRGHEVAVAASPNYETNVQRAGMSFQSLRPVIPHDPDLLEYYFDMKRGPGRLLREVVFDQIRQTHADLERLSAGADLLVVGELLYTAPIIAENLRIPWMNVILAPTSMLSATDPCVLAPAPFLHPFRHLGAWVHQMAYVAGRLQGRMWASGYFRFRKELGLPAGANPIFDAKHSPHGTLAMFPSFFGSPQPDWPSEAVSCGFPFFQQPVAAGDEAVQEFLKSGEPPIVFTLGSIVAHFEPRFYQVAADVAVRLGRRAVLLTGRDAGLPAHLPDPILAVEYARLSEILPHAVAIVHAGGIGTCAEAMRAGIPSVVIPFSFDQPDNAFRMRRLGVGEILSRRSISASALARKLQRILDDRHFSIRAKMLSKNIDPAEAVRIAVDRMESAV